MTPSLRALLTGIIDYAGLFPPARLPLDQALRAYARYRQEEDSWMLGRFVCQAARLNEVLPYLPELFGSGPPLVVSALGRGGVSVREFLSGLQQDLADIVAARAAGGGRLVVDVLETPVAEDRLKGRVPALLDVPRLIAETTAPQPLFPFFEISPSGGEPLISLCQGLGGQAGVKLRTGGLEAAAFPKPQRVASIIAECAAEGVPLKFTAGLHHPLRHFNPGVNTRMHGFLNIFVAGVLAAVHRLKGEVLCALLEDEDARHFRWQENGMSWQEWQVSLTDMERVRQRGVISFGSCSFDEPREDLRALGWL